MRDEFPQSCDVRDVVPKSCDVRYVVPQSYDVRDGVPQSYNLRDVVPHSYVVRDVFPQSCDVRNVVPHSYDVRDVLIQSCDVRDVILQSCDVVLSPKRIDRQMDEVFGASNTEKKVYQPIVSFLQKMHLEKKRKFKHVMLKSSSKWLTFRNPVIARKLSIMFKRLMQEMVSSVSLSALCSLCLLFC